MVNFHFDLERPWWLASEPAVDDDSRKQWKSMSFEKGETVVLRAVKLTKKVIDLPKDAGKVEMWKASEPSVADGKLIEDGTLVMVRERFLGDWMCEFVDGELKGQLVLVHKNKEKGSPAAVAYLASKTGRQQATKETIEDVAKRLGLVIRKAESAIIEAAARTGNLHSDEDDEKAAANIKA